MPATMRTAAFLLLASVASATGKGKVTFPLKKTPVAGYPKFTTVFGVAVFGQKGISAAKFQHMASVLAEWLDNDEDGCVDNPLVLSKMATASPKPSTMAIEGDGTTVAAGADAVGVALDKAGYTSSVVTYDNEILPKCAGTAATDNCADSTLEEVLHMVTSQGYAKAYPSIFGVEPPPMGVTSKLMTAMDVARGGKFETVPTSYPSTAWYTYKQQDCIYNCQATEYIYWGISAYVGSLAGRKADKEWKQNTRAKLLAKDKLLSAILQDTKTYKVPSRAPNGVYKGATTCAKGTNHGGTKA